MRWLRILIRNRLRRRTVDEDVDDELRATVGLLAAEQIRAGVSPEEAERTARAAFGSVEAVREAVRATRRGAFLDVLSNDVRYAVRALRRTPLFTLSAAGSLALGIGTTTAIFSVANALLLRAAPGVVAPAHLVELVRRNPASGPGIELMSYPDLLDVRSQASSFTDVFGHQLELLPTAFRAGDRVRAVHPVLVTNNYFRTLGVGAALGRVIDAGDSDRPGASPVAVLTHTFWRRQFNANPQVVGQTIWLNDVPVTIVGVAAAGFQGLSIVAPDLWLPVGMIAVQWPDGRGRELSERIPWLALGARLKAGVSLRQASAEVAVIGAGIQQATPTAMVPPGDPVTPERTAADLAWSAARATPIPFGIRAIAASFSGLLLAVVSTLLVIACANVAGVLLARAASRRREIAVRQAVGATRARLVRQLVTETVVLFVIGACGGLWLSRLVIDGLLRLLPAFAVSLNLSAPVDGTVVAFTLVVSLVGALGAGLAPALHGTRTDVVSALKNDEQGPANGHRLRQVFVVTQVAGSLLLVVVAGLLVRGFDTLIATQPGFDPRGVDAVTLDLSLAGHGPAAGVDAMHRLVEAAERIPGVTGVSVADRLPGDGARQYGLVAVLGGTPIGAAPDTRFNFSLTSPGYFSLLGMRLLGGRDFTASDAAGAEPVAVLGSRAAAALWPGDDAVGRYLEITPTIASQGREPRTVHVVGVIAETATDTRGFALYLPWAQWYVPTVTLLTKVGPDRPSIAASVQAAVTAAEPTLPVVSAQALDATGNGPIETQLRVAANIAGSVGLVGMLLAAFGIYGVTAYLVTQRTREFGIRLALGATAADIIRLVLRQGLRLVAVGSTIGLVLGVAAGRVLAGRQFGIPQFDPVVMIVATVAFIATGLVACYVPVRRAARIQAMEALRND